jgi:hypothetical protein
MRIPRNLILGTACGAALILLAGGCKSGTGSSGGDPVRTQLKNDLEESFGHSPGLLDGLDRLLDAAAGGPADGVVLVSNGNTVSGTVEVDLDGDGTRETTLTGQAFFTATAGDFDGGATVGFSSPTGEGAGGYVQTVGQTAVVSAVSGTLGVPAGDFQTILTDGGVNIDLTTANLDGYIELEVLGGEDPLFATVHFEDDGMGGWHMRVTGSGDSFEFFVP